MLLIPVPMSSHLMPRVATHMANNTLTVHGQPSFGLCVNVGMINVAIVCRCAWS